LKPPIRAMAVAVPARNEGAHIERCLRAIGMAAKACPVPVFLTVAADRCHDDTVALAQRAVGRLPTGMAAEVVECRADSVGAARQLACCRAVSAAAGLAAAIPPGAAAAIAPASPTAIPPGSPGDASCSFEVGSWAPGGEIGSDGVWLAVTDADSVVPIDWLSAQLGWADRGLDGVAGLVVIDACQGASSLAAARFADWTSARGNGIGHRQVYAANLGMRASYWKAVGGFAPLGLGEDEDLWDRLRAAGAALLGVNAPVVATSGRTIGRTPGGFAGLMTELTQG
jgi:hypothetical protein